MANIKITTTMGDITVRLYDETPLHRDNFVKLASEGYYDNVLFHRVIENFMIQGGDPDSKNAPAGKQLGMGGPDYTIKAEIKPNLFHKRGALCAARMGDEVNPNRESSGSQFYIVTGGAVSMDTLKQYEEHGDGSYTKEQKELYTTIGGAPWLDGKYTVFGQVVDGLDVAITISEQETDSNNKPYTSIIMDSVTVEPYDGSELHWYASSATEPSETSDDAA